MLQLASASVDISYGAENTADLSSWAGVMIGRWDLEAAAGMAHTDGYILIPTSQRGLVDTLANSEHATVDAGVGYQVTEGGRAFLRGTFFDEARHNGTPIQKNSTGTGFGVAGVNSPIHDHDFLSARVYGESLSRPSPPHRNREQLTDIQHVPSQTARHSRSMEPLVFEPDTYRWSRCERSHGCQQRAVISRRPRAFIANNVASGRQRTVGIFGQDIIRIRDNWVLIGGVRWDDWRNFNGTR
jgi:hypothetical protein